MACHHLINANIISRILACDEFDIDDEERRLRGSRQPAKVGQYLSCCRDMTAMASPIPAAPMVGFEEGIS